MTFAAVKKTIMLSFSAMLLTFSQHSVAQKIGISLPNPDKPRFNIDAETMSKELESKGHETIIKCADRTVETQIKDIETLIEKGCDYLVIIPIDGEALSGVLKKAEDKNIPVISYDRLITNTDAVKYYATFDNYKVGQMLGEYIVEKLNLKNTEETKYIEIFSGDQHDNNVEAFWSGSMEVLKPYFDQDKLICPSGVYTKEGTYTFNWSTEEAKKRMIKLIDEFNLGAGEGKQRIDAVLCHSDGIAQGVIEALYQNAGYKKHNFPVVTGQDCQVKNLQFLKRGLQSMCIFKDARVLGYATANMILQMINGETVTVNSTDSYSIGEKSVPTLLCSPKLVDKNNMRELVIESGYYELEELKQ